MEGAAPRESESERERGWPDRRIIVGERVGLGRLLLASAVHGQMRP